MMLKDKTAVITGAGSGIGAAIARQCAQEGMKIVIADIEGSSLAKIENELKSLGIDVVSVICDVAKEWDVKLLFEKVIHEFGEIHYLFNNAGVSTGNLIWKTTKKDWEWVLGVNLWGIINVIRTFVPSLLNQDCECHIVNTSSVAGLTSAPGNGIYSVTKHAIVTISETLFYELKLLNSKINVSVLCPGFVNTNLINSERNRPIELTDEDTEEIDIFKKSTKDMLSKEIINGMPPKKVAEEVFKAIENKKFYILTHQESKGLIKQRMNDILNEDNPTIYFDTSQGVSN